MNVINELRKNIIGIVFIHTHTHTHKQTYNVLSWQLKFAGAFAYSIAASETISTTGDYINNCESKL